MSCPFSARYQACVVGQKPIIKNLAKRVIPCFATDLGLKLTRFKMNKNNNGSTAERILDIAQDLLQRQGYNGFSYQDIAERVKIRKASIHYHFPSKGDLAVSLSARYVDQFIERLHQLDRKHKSSLLRIRELTQIYSRIIKDKEKLCPVIMLSAEMEALPAAAQEHLRRFISETERWLGQTLEQGKRAHELQFLGSFQSQARLLLATLQGAMLLARASGERGHFQSIADDLLKQLQLNPARPVVRTDAADSEVSV